MRHLIVSERDVLTMGVVIIELDIDSLWTVGAVS